MPVGTGVQQTRAQVLIAMPTYDEEKYIGSMVLKARQYADEVLVVDDGSKDDTAEVARLAGARVIRHAQNKGKGAAMQTILAEAKKKNPDVLVVLDADYQHDPDEIPHLIEPILQGFDLVIGSREKEAGKTPRYRRFGQKVLSFASGVLSGRRFADSECGFRCLSRKAIFEIELNENGFAHEAEMIARATDKDLKITQIAISNIYHKDGSTMNPIRHGFGVLARILVMISERRPLFFFGLGGTISVITGLLAGSRVLHVFSNYGVLAVGTSLVSVLLIAVGMFSIFTGIILNALARRKS